MSGSETESDRTLRSENSIRPVPGDMWLPDRHSDSDFVLSFVISVEYLDPTHYRVVSLDFHKHGDVYIDDDMWDVDSAWFISGSWLKNSRILKFSNGETENSV